MGANRGTPPGPEAFGFSVTLAEPPEEVEARLRRLLADEGFGVLTEIDVRETLRERIGVEFRPYRILGACNPRLAHAALAADPAAGLLLPCNVVVEADGGTTTCRFLNPEALMGGVPGTVGEVAALAAEKLRRVASRLPVPEGG